MRNLLPERNRRIVKREYYARLAVIALILIATALLLGTVSFLPTYFALQSKHMAIQEQVKFVEDSLALRDGSTSLAEVRSTNAKLKSLQNDRSRLIIEDLVRAVVDQKPAGITLSSFYIERSEEEGTIEISGQASSRDALISFREFLEQTEEFTEVDLPVSNLAQTQNIDFEVTITGQF